MERLIRLLGLREYLSAFNYNFFCYEWKVKQASKYGELGFWDQEKLSFKTLQGTCGFINGEQGIKSKEIKESWEHVLSPPMGSLISKDCQILS